MFRKREPLTLLNKGLYCEFFFSEFCETFKTINSVDDVSEICQKDQHFHSCCFKLHKFFFNNKQK